MDPAFIEHQRLLQVFSKLGSVVHKIWSFYSQQKKTMMTREALEGHILIANTTHVEKSKFVRIQRLTGRRNYSRAIN